MVPIQVITPADAIEHAQGRNMTETTRFWQEHMDLMGRLQVGDEFWADAVVRLKREGKPLEAAALCRQAKPVPAAYRDLLICLRKILRHAGEQQPLLRELYASAVEASVLHRVKYVEYEVNGRKTGCPGFNAASILWQRLQEQPRDVQYSRIGYEHVEWLNKTDRRRLAEAWGEPDSHQDPFDMFRSDWESAVSEHALRESRRAEERKQDWNELPSTPLQKGSQRKRRFWPFG